MNSDGVPLRARDLSPPRRYTAPTVTIRFHNTLTQKLETFEPMVPGKASML